LRWALTKPLRKLNIAVDGVRVKDAPERSKENANKCIQDPPHQLDWLAMLGQGENSTPLLLKPQELTGMQMKSFKNDSLLASTAGNKRKGENASLKMKVDAYQLCPLLDGSWGIATRRLLNSTQNRFKSGRQIFKQWLLHSMQNTAKTGRLMLTQRLLHTMQNTAKTGRRTSTQRLSHSLQNTAH
jgi:hypothetical protein